MARGSVIKRYWKDGKRFSYAIKYRLPDGRQRLETIGSSKREAERELAQRMDELYRGTYRELDDALFSDFAAQWLAQYAEPRVKPSTYETYEGSIRLGLLPAFGHRPLRQITPTAVNEFLASSRASGKSAYTVNRALSVLRLMLRHAVEWGYLATNPASAVRRLPTRRGEVRVLAPAEIRRFLAEVDASHWLLFVVAFGTGLRQGELIALQWRDIDWARSRLRVRRSLWRGQYVTPKSSRSTRWVDLSQSALHALQEVCPTPRPDDADSSLIFTSQVGTPLIPGMVVKRKFLPALERAGLPRIRFHDIRHTYASLLIAAGAHPKYIQMQMGHASIQTTLDLYGHLFPEHSYVGDGLDGALTDNTALPRPKLRARRVRQSKLPPAVRERIERELRSGRGCADIARGLEADGIPTSSGQGRWRPSTVRYIASKL